VKRNYSATAQKWKSDNRGLKKNAWIDDEAKARCLAKGLFQGRTNNS
jgi:hypothetical protein